MAFGLCTSYKQGVSRPATTCSARYAHQPSRSPPANSWLTTRTPTATTWSSWNCSPPAGARHERRQHFLLPATNAPVTFNYTIQDDRRHRRGHGHGEHLAAGRPGQPGPGPRRERHPRDLERSRRLHEPGPRPAARRRRHCTPRTWHDRPARFRYRITNYLEKGADHRPAGISGCGWRIDPAAPCPRSAEE